MVQKTWILLLIITGVIAKVNAQTPNYYFFESKTTTYTELVNDTIVEGAYANPTGVWMLNLAGETYGFFEKPYPLNNTTKHIVFSNNGFVRIEDDSTFIVIDAAFTNVDSIDANTAVSYIIDGTPGNRIIKVQWKNLKLSSGATGNFVNYQIWLYQKTGVFEIYYGPSSTNNQNGFNTTNGPNIGLFYSLKSFTKMFEKIWVNGSPGNYTLDSNRTVVFNAVSGVPTANTLFRFVPKKVAANISTDKLLNEVAQVFPNPANGIINIHLKQPITLATTATLQDMSGRNVAVYNLSEHQLLHSLSIPQIAAGIYTLTVQSGETNYTQKITIAP